MTYVGALLFTLAALAQTPPETASVCQTLKQVGFVAFAFRDHQRVQLGAEPVLIKDGRVVAVVRSMRENACATLSMQIRPKKAAADSPEYWDQALDLVFPLENAPLFDLRRGAAVNVFKEGNNLAIYDQD